MSEHINKFNKKSFSARYNISKLVYYEIFNNPLDAIAREKQIKAGSRRKKINLIERYNSNWRDLSDVTAAEDFLKQISLQ
jgi:putative endonuclease